MQDFIAILGRQPHIGMAELERTFGDVQWFAHDAATIKTDSFDIQRLGGTVKAGRIIAQLPRADWRQASMKIVEHYTQEWSGATGKITLGISAYGFKLSPRDVQRTGIILKSRLKNAGVSLRLVPNEQAVLGSATSHHNKLGLAPNKVELMVVRGHGGAVIVAESTGAQNITALARRDQERPARDAFVGMLPPKLAQIMINLAIGFQAKRVADGGAAPASVKISDFSEEGADRLTGPVSSDLRADFASAKSNDGSGAHTTILDPFCGTGVVLQEAALLGYSVYGTDLSEKMVDYSRRNLEWLATKYHTSNSSIIEHGDAMDTTWRQPIDAVACEAYLGQPFSAPPSPAKLEQVRGNCDHIITEFLKNIGGQLQPGTPLCVAVPAWNDGQDNFTHLPLIKKLAQLGYKQIEFKNVHAKDLLYYREGQVVARELLVLAKI